MGTTISGPGFVSLLVRDLTSAADFYENTVGLERDPQAFPGSVAFKSTPIPFAVAQAPAEVNLDQLPKPGLGISLWLKAADGQAAYEALNAANVPIVKAPYDGPFGRTFVFSDPDGYTITVYERDEPDLSRLPPR